MKKIMFYILGCAVSVVMMFGTYSFVMKQDSKGPVIKLSLDRDELLYNNEMKESDFLKAFRAVDEDEGDVSDSLMVEKLTHSRDDDTVRIVVAAMDSHYNVTKETYTVRYGEFEIDKSDVTNQASVAVAPTTGPTENPEEIREAAAEEEIRLLPSSNPVIRLTQYEVVLPAGSTFNFLDYIKEITDDKDTSDSLYHSINLNSDLNSKNAGTYTVEYYVNDSDGNMSNVAQLHVIIQ